MPGSLASARRPLPRRVPDTAGRAAGVQPLEPLLLRELSEAVPLPLRLKRRRSSTEGIEAFVGKRVHEVLERLYQLRGARHGALAGQVIWRVPQNFERAVRRDAGAHRAREGTRAGLTAQRASAASRTTTAATTPSTRRDPRPGARRSRFALDADGRYALRGIIDRLVRARDGALEIHDYKTGRRVPSQDELDRDRQLGALRDRRARGAPRGRRGPPRLALPAARPGAHVATQRRSSSTRCARRRAPPSTGSAARPPGRRGRAGSAPGASIGRSARPSARWRRPPSPRRRTSSPRRATRASSRSGERAHPATSRAGHLVASRDGAAHRTHPDLEGQLHLPPRLRGDRRGGRRRRARGRAGGAARRGARRARHARSSRPTTTPITRWRTRSSRSATTRRSSATSRTPTRLPGFTDGLEEGDTRRGRHASRRASSSSPPTRAATSPTSSTRRRRSSAATRCSPRAAAVSSRARRR